LQHGRPRAGGSALTAPQMMARHFQGRGVKIYTIDKNQFKYDGSTGAGSMIADACEMLKKYPDVKCVFGNSALLAPQLAEIHKNDRVMVFIDGPKRDGAVLLCAHLMEKYDNIPLCGIHDTAVPGTHDGEGHRVRGWADMQRMFRGMLRWNRTALQTEIPPWRSAYASIDHGCEWDRVRYPSGFGLSIIAGKVWMPGEVSCRGIGFKGSNCDFMYDGVLPTRDMIMKRRG